MFKKMCLTFGVLMVGLCGMENVSAKEYTDADFLTLIAGSTPITKDDTLTVAGDVYIGENGAFTINDGSVTFSLDESTGAKRILMTIDGDVTLSEGENFFIKVPDALSTVAQQQNIEGFSLALNEDDIFTIDGTVIIPSTGTGTIINNGTINVNGAVELRSKGYYTGTGTTNVFSKFVIYGTTGANVSDDVVFTLNKNGALYTDYDIAMEKIISGVNTMTVSTASSKEYQSVSANVVTANQDNTFAYGYELKTIEEPTDPGTTTPPVTEPTEPEEVTNPNTFDGIYSSIALVAMGSIAFIVVAMKLRKKVNN